MKLRGVGGGASCAGGDGVGAVGEKLGGTRRNSKGMGGVRVFFGEWEWWELWGLGKERVMMGIGGDGSVGVVRADRELGKERVVVGAVRAGGTVGGDENKRGCPKSFS